MLFLFLFCPDSQPVRNAKLDGRWDETYDKENEVGAPSARKLSHVVVISKTDVFEFFFLLDNQVDGSFLDSFVFFVKGGLG